MAIRMAHVAGVFIVAATVPLVGCGSGEGAERGESKAAAVEVAKKYQQALLDEDWKVVCELRTRRLRGGTVTKCFNDINQPLLRDPSGFRLSRSEPFEVDAYEGHPAGLGMRTSSCDPDGVRACSHTALRLVVGGDGEWLVDQLANLDETIGTDADDVRARLQGRWADGYD